MKKLRSIIAICLCSFWVVFMGSCAKQLSSPTDFQFDVATQTLSWDKVSNASSYTIEINGKEVTTRANSYSLAGLDAGIYDVKVKANGDDSETTDSEWAVYENFERVAESGLMYQLINNNTEYELVGVGSAKGDVVMETVFRNKPVTSIAEGALRNNRFTSFVLGENVTTIGKRAFYNSQHLTEIEIPENVVSIGESLFQSCRKLKKVKLPERITEIPDYTFASCGELEEFTISSKTTSIGNNAFTGCSKLKTLTLPATVETIGENAFYRCEGLSGKIDLGDSLISIGKAAFSNCVNVTSVDFGDKLKTIAANAFHSCVSLTSITLPDSINSIGDRAFYATENLLTVDLGGNLESMGAYVFHESKIFMDAADGKNTDDQGIVLVDDWLVGCKNTDIVNIYIPSNVSGVADYAFAGNYEKLNTVNLPSVKYVGNAAFYICKTLTVAIFGNNLKKVGYDAFVGCETLKQVILGESLVEIGSYAFSGCKALTGLSIPNTVDSIGTFAFINSGLPAASDGIIYVGNDDNPNLWVVGVAHEFINFPEIKEGTKGIAEYSFVDCILIQDITLPNSLEYIGRGAFYGCGVMFMMSVNIPENLKEIGDYAFYECPGLTLRNEFKEAKNLEKIGRSAFYGATLLGAKEIQADDEGYAVPIPGRLDLTGVKEIGDYAFFGCTSIETLMLGNGVEKIGNRVFHGNSSLKTVQISNSVKEMGIRVFYKCEALETAIIGNGMKEIPDYTFYGCKSLKNVVFVEGGGVERVGKYAFRDCVNLSDINFGDSLKTMDDYSFFGCSGLTELVIPNTVESIGKYAFRNCSSLTSVVIPETLLTLGKHAFYGANSATFYCEAEGIPAYWDSRWNSSYRTVVWDCGLSEDDTYVVSVEKSVASITNPEVLNGISAPTRAGATFGGWALAPDSTEVAYTTENITSVPDGVILYAIWL